MTLSEITFTTIRSQSIKLIDFIEKFIYLNTFFSIALETKIAQLIADHCKRKDFS